MTMYSEFFSKSPLIQQRSLPIGTIPQILMSLIRYKLFCRDIESVQHVTENFFKMKMYLKKVFILLLSIVSQLHKRGTP